MATQTKAIQRTNDTARLHFVGLLLFHTTRIMSPSVNDNANDKEQEDQGPPPITDAPIRPSISIRMIRHAESQNNEVYRNGTF